MTPPDASALAESATSVTNEFGSEEDFEGVITRAVSEVSGAGPRQEPDHPPLPSRFEDTGLTEDLVLELLIKALYSQGELTAVRISQDVALPFVIVDPLLEHLKREQEVEVKGVDGNGRAFYRYAITGHGRERAREALERCQYVGPAPVPLQVYAEWVRRQTVNTTRISWEDMTRGFSNLVLSNRFLMMLGPAVNSGKSLFLYGPAGNGKTLVAETIGSLLGGSIWVPYAVEVGGQIIKVHDPVYHAEPQEEEEEGAGGRGLWRDRRQSVDPRWVLSRRPTVFTGGELTLDMLDLRYNAIAKFYEAPFQVKSNGGVFILDDFGRQLVSPVELLNRWIVPLEKRVDYLTLHTGKKFPVPFDCLLIFATNLDPDSLVDEAFFRRIRYKVKAEDPTREEYGQIFFNYCRQKGVKFVPEAVMYLFKRYYAEGRIQPRSCHPRDLIDHLIDFANFYGVPPVLSKTLIDRACQSYFVEGKAPGNGVE
ncbi:MAG: ATP-binding protein [Gemmatimonadota bacterium]